MIVKTRRLTRQELGDFLPTNKAIRAFESVQDDVLATGEALSTAPAILTEASTDFPAARVLTGSANVSLTDDGPGAELVLDLTDTGVDANTYGSATRILIIAIDAKGRISDAQEVKIDVSDVDGTLAADHGGTGQSGYVIGDLLFANGAASLSRLADVATGNVLLSGGVATAPMWGKVGLTTHVDGVLPEANGGTGTTTPGFTGSGTYTNFTFQNGKCTSAT